MSDDQNMTDMVGGGVGDEVGGVGGESKTHILVVDDDPAMRQIITRVLEMWGYSFDSVTGGESCLEYLKTHEVDALLLDYMMPGMTGVEVIKEIRKEFKPDRLPVIMVTALNASKEVVAGLEAGANDYITKPIDFPVLKARINVAVQLKKSVDQLVDAERQRVMLESLGAACHHLAQPLTVILCNLEMLEANLDKPDNTQEMRKRLGEVMEWTNEVNSLLQNMRKVSQYRTIPYLNQKNIIDIAPQSSQGS